MEGWLALSIEGIPLEPNEAGTGIDAGRLLRE
jgi:hypothetical protein